jgi:putative transposase
VYRQGPAGQKGDLGEPEATGANPTDRGKCGSKRHLLTDGQGVPLALVLSGANRTDMKKLEALLDARLIEAPPAGERHLCLDRGYDYDDCRATAVGRGYTPHIPPKASAARPLPPPGHPDRHPPRRWVVEAGHSWFNRYRRLLIRWEKKAAHYLAFAQLAACLIIYRKLRHARLLSG